MNGQIQFAPVLPCYLQDFWQIEDPSDGQLIAVAIVNNSLLRNTTVCFEQKRSELLTERQTKCCLCVPDIVI